VRQESEFNPTVISRSNAYGLTQIVPATGRELARKAGIRQFRTNMLFQPATNLRLGTSYLRSLLDQWGGKWEQTLASYNAGKSRAMEWMTWANFQEPAEFVETIPFTQTRDYVQAVLRNAAAYRRIYGVKPAAGVIEPVEIRKVAVAATPAKRPVKKAKRTLRRS
jgi:soluble lytic murein transglycosylase